MTIEQLLDLPPEGLEAIPDDKLTEMLAPYFKFTRPENPIGPKMNGSVMTPGSVGQRGPRASSAGGGPNKSTMNAALNVLMKSDKVTIEEIRAMANLIKK